MRRAQITSKFVFTVLCLAVVVTAVFKQATSQTLELRWNVPLGRELTSGQTHEYQLSLKAGEFAQVLVEQKGIKVILSIHSADGKQMAEMDSPNEQEDFETRSFIADNTGIYLVKIKRLEQENNAESGKYIITLTAQSISEKANPDAPQLIVSTGHSSTINSAAFSPDGKTLASGSSDKTIKLWNVATGRELKTLKGHTSFVYSVAFSPDGKTLASGSWDKTIKLWDVATGRELKTLNGHTFDVNSVVFSPDGKTLASGDLDNVIKLWDVATGRELKTLKGHTTSVWSVAFSPDGRTLASGGWDNTIKLWDVTSGQELISLTEQARFVLSVAFSPDGKTLASGSDDKTIKLWDVATGRELKTLKGHTTSVWSVAFSPDGRTLASGSETVKLWDVATGQELRTLTDQSASPRSIIFSPDGKNIVYAGRNGITSQRITTGEIIWNVGTTRFEIKSVVLSPDNKNLAISDNEGNFAFWDVVKGQRISMSEIPTWAKAQKSTETYHGLVIQANGDNVKLIDEATKRETATLFLIDKDDWAVVDSDQRVDCSFGAENYMHYVFSTSEGYEIIDFSQLKERYYEPNLLLKLLGYNKEPLRDVAQFKDVLLPPSVIPIKPKDAKSTVRQIKLRNRNGGIGRVQVFVNGREFIEDARDAKLKANPNLKQYVLSFDLKKTPLISGQKPDVKVVAWNFDEKAKGLYKGYISSPGTEIDYLPTATQTVEPPRLYGIIGGVSDYKGNTLDLRFASQDAEDIYQAISVGGTNLFGKGGVKLKLLSTGGSKDAILPTKRNFRQAFEEFAREAKPNDILFVYLAGHGITLNPGNDTYYYLTQEASTTNKETLSKDSRLLLSSTINSEELMRWLNSVKALKQVLILDTCAAGAATSSLINKRDLPGNQIRAIQHLKDRTGIFVLMGSAADAVSYEASQYGQGLLTYSLLQGMKGAALLEDGQIDVSKLFNYAADTVPSLAKNISGIQRPVVMAPLGGASFTIGLIKSDEDKKLIPLARVKPIILRPNFQNQKLGYDNLKITQLLRSRLREASNSTNVVNAGFLFLDVEEMPDGIIPVGNYSVDKEQVEINLALLRNDELAARTTVIGTTNDPDELILLMIKAIERLVVDLKNKTSGSDKTKTLNPTRLKVSQLNQTSFLQTLSSRNQFASNPNHQFKYVSYDPAIQIQGDKIVIIRPRFLSDKKPLSAIKFEGELVKFLNTNFGEGKNDRILYKDVDDFTDAVRLEWSYEEDNETSTIQIYFSKNGEKPFDKKDVTCPKGMIQLLTTSISKWILTSAYSLTSKIRGAELVGPPTNLRQMMGKQYALLIATDDYEWLHPLSNPVLDVCTIAKILRDRYGFEIDLAINKSKKEINQIIRRYLARTYEENSELLIFIAGHGVYDRMTRLGYLATKDSAVNDDEFNTYISFPELVGKIDKIPVEHIWLVADTCNAGLITKETSRNVEGRLSKEDFVRDRLRGKTRMALAATEGANYVGDGTPGEHSPFARDFIDILLTDGGRDGNGILITSEFATTLFENKQKPRFGKLSESDAPGSDFVFLLLDEKERKRLETPSDIKECKCVFQLYGKEKYNPKEVCDIAK